LTALSHDIKNSDTQWSHSQKCCQLPDVHEKGVVWNLLSTGLIVDGTSINEVLEASERSNIGLRKLDDKFN